MSIRLEINAADTFELHSEMKKILRGDTNMHFLDAPRQTGGGRYAPDVQLSGGEHDKQPDDAEAKLLDAGASPEFAAAQVAPPNQKKRGPKPKSAANPPSQPVAPSVAQTDDAVTAAPPSDGAGQPAAEAQSGTPSPAASADLSFDEFKAKLNALTAEENGLTHVSTALGSHGYSKVRDVEPEHYAGVLAKAQELVG